MGVWLILCGVISIFLHLVRAVLRAGTGDSVAAFGGVEVQKRQAVRDEPVHASRRRRGRNPRRHRAVHRAIHLGRAVVPASGSSPDAELRAAPDRGRMTAFQDS